MNERKRGAYIAFPEGTMQFLDMIVSMTAGNSRTDYVVKLIEERIVEIFNDIDDIHNILDKLYSGHSVLYRQMQERVASGQYGKPDEETDNSNEEGYNDNEEEEGEDYYQDTPNPA